MDADDEGKNKNTERILHFISDNPGCHLRQIRKNMGISMGTTQYHLNVLEKTGKISSVRSGLHKYYFPIAVFHDNEKNLLQILNQETSREILMFIVEKGRPTHSDIAQRIGVSSSSISWHISRFETLEIIRTLKDGKFKRYELNIDPKYLVGLMKNYYPNIWNKWSNRLAEIFILLSTERSSTSKEHTEYHDDK
jgi:predicted transcriptional regulator